MGNLMTNFKSKNNQRFEGENERFKSAVKILKREKYKYKRKLGMGTFGDVIEVYTFDCCKRKKYAAKIVSTGECSRTELELWRSFHHDNVLPLLKIIRESNITIFMMPLHKMTMMQAAKEDSFLEDTESFSMSKNWINDVLRGLEYLHAINICHADLKIDNVLITKRRTAVICDFTFSCLMTGNISEYGLPRFFRPPEAFSPDDVNGEYFDLWSFGMLSLFTWTGIWSNEVISSVEYWKKLAYPVIFDYLQLPKFTELVKQFFPNATITPEDISHALNLIKGVLQYEAEKRPRASIILQHPLLNKESRQENLLEVSSIWSYRHFQLPNDLGNSSSDIDEWLFGTEIDPRTQEFTNFDTYVRDSSENRTNDIDENTFKVKADVTLPVIMEKSEDKFKENSHSIDVQDYQPSNAGVTKKSMLSATSEFCHSQIRYLGCSLLHEVLMTLWT